MKVQDKRNIRRQAALTRLETQLKKGTKPEKVAAITLHTTGADEVPLDDKDKERIKKEIGVLKNRILLN